MRLQERSNWHRSQGFIFLALVFMSNLEGCCSVIAIITSPSLVSQAPTCKPISRCRQYRENMLLGDAASLAQAELRPLCAAEWHGLAETGTRSGPPMYIGGTALTLTRAAGPRRNVGNTEVWGNREARGAARSCGKVSPLR